MPHIHTKPDQHDMTVSAYILRRDGAEWRCLVHYHKKIEKLMQIGGHIELNETPWQALAHELEEESGYTLDELSILQPTKVRVVDVGNISHPVPFTTNTHNVGNEHYHSDNCYGFIAASEPREPVATGESNDLRWLALPELEQAAANETALSDVVKLYEFLVECAKTYVAVPASDFSLDKPAHSKEVVYKRGAAGG